MLIISEILETIFNSIRFSIRDMMVFPGKNLKPVMQMCWIISGLSFIFALFKIPVLTNWVGALVASIMLSAIYFVTILKPKSEPISLEDASPEE